MVDMSDILQNIPVTFLDRRRMKAAKSWRCILELPTDRENLPEVLTAMMESQVRIELVIPSQLSVVIDPAYIFDVPRFKGKFHLQVETVYENQSHIGPKLTAMVNKAAFLSILPVSGEPEMPPVQNEAPKPETIRPGDISDESLRGLHVAFFKNRRFWEYVTYLTSETVGCEKSCKVAFKHRMQVESCRHIMQADFDLFLKEFNTWLRGGR